MYISLYYDIYYLLKMLYFHMLLLFLILITLISQCSSIKNSLMRTKIVCPTDSTLDIKTEKCVCNNPNYIWNEYINKCNLYYKMRRLNECDTKSVFLNESCHTCPYATSSNSNNTCNCKEENENLIWNSTIADCICSNNTFSYDSNKKFCSCPENSPAYYENIGCISCPKPLTLFNTINNKCECIPNDFKYDPILNKCVCYDNKQVLVEQEKVCKTCPSNTVKINQNSCKCFDSKLIWEPSINLCICPFNSTLVYSEISQSEICLSCPTDSFYSLQNQICKCNDQYKEALSSDDNLSCVIKCIDNKVNIILNNECQLCPSNSKRLSYKKCICNSSFLKWNPVNNSCECELSNSIISTDKCIKCPINSTVNSEKTTCKCHSDKKSYDIQLNSCICMSQYIQINDDCQLCPSNAIKLENICDCSSNDLYKYWNNTANLCTCDEKMIMINNKCDYCIENSIKSSYDQCKCLDNNLTWNRLSNQCQLCIEPFKFNSNGTCIDCAIDSIKISDDECKCNDINLKWDKTLNKCICLFSNQVILPNNTCIECPLGSSRNTYNSCTCDKDNLWNSILNICECNIFDTNTNKLKWDNNINECICNDDSKYLYNNIANNSYVCLSCPSEISYKRDYKSCQCNNSILTWNQSMNICECSNNEIFIENTCKSCPINSQKYDYSSCICNSFNSYQFEWRKESNKCFCLNGDVYRSNSSECLSCPLYSFIDQNDPSKCICTHEYLSVYDINTNLCICNQHQELFSTYHFYNNTSNPSLSDCRKCPSNSILSGNSKCLCEEENKQWEVDLNLCTCKEDNEILSISNKCMKCPSNSIRLNEKSCLCRDTNAEYDYNQNLCLCRNDSYYNSNLFQCEKCVFNSLKIGEEQCECNLTMLKWDKQENLCYCQGINDIFFLNNTCITCPTDSIRVTETSCKCNSKELIWNSQTNSCELCGFNEIILNNTCILCPANSIKISSTECKCNDNSQKWDLNKNNCSCIKNNNYILKNNTCVECSNDSLVSIHNSSLCICNDKNKLWNDNNQCECIGENFFFNNTCQQCPGPLFKKSLIEFNSCECQSEFGFIWSFTEGKCICNQNMNYIHSEINDLACILCNETETIYHQEKNKNITICKCSSDTEIYSIKEDKCICRVYDNSQSCIDCYIENDVFGYQILSSYYNQTCKCIDNNKEYDILNRSCVCNKNHMTLSNNSCINCNSISNSTGITTTSGECECKYNMSLIKSLSSDSYYCDCNNDEIYNSLSNRCDKCQYGKDFSNKENKCLCGEYEIWDENKMKCVCSSDSYFSIERNKCIDCKYNSLTLVNGVNSTYNGCICPFNLVYSEENLICSCKNDNEIYISLEGSNDKSDNNSYNYTCLSCPIYSNKISVNKCKCDDYLSLIISNTTDGLLISCDCIDNNSSIIYNEKCKTCPYGMSRLNRTACNCHEKNMKFNMNYDKNDINTLCINCLDNSLLDKEKNKCICTENYIYNEELDKCELCKNRTIFIKSSDSIGECFECNENEYSYNNKCISCPEDSILDKDKNECDCKLENSKNSIFNITSNQCHSCNSNEISVNNTCIECLDNKIRFKNTCVNCPSNSNFNKNNNTCECEVRYVYNEEINECIKCSYNQISTKENECKNCEEHSFSLSNNICKKCNGRRIFSNKFQSEINNQLTDSQIENLICIQCPIGKYANELHSLCLNCELYSTTDLTITNNKCMKCKDILPYSVYNSTSKKCDLCPNFSIFVPSVNENFEGSCKRCPSKKDISDKRSNQCITCDYGFIPSIDNENVLYDKCIECDENMIEINNKCVLCPPCTKANKNKLNIKYNSCQRIKDYCIDNIPVDICPEGYFADIDRICKSCKEINILNGMIYEQNNKCVESCDIEFYYNKNNSCKKCTIINENEPDFIKKCNKSICITDDVILYNLKKYFYKFKCFNSCPSGTGLIKSKNRLLQNQSKSNDDYVEECFECKAYNRYIHNGECLSKCPNGLIQNSENICSEMKCDSIKCYNDGICIMTESGPECKCKNEYYLKPDCNLSLENPSQIEEYFNNTINNVSEKGGDISKVIDIVNEVSLKKENDFFKIILPIVNRTYYNIKQSIRNSYDYNIGSKEIKELKLINTNQKDSIVKTFEIFFYTYMIAFNKTIENTRTNDKIMRNLQGQVKDLNQLTKEEYNRAIYQIKTDLYNLIVQFAVSDIKEKRIESSFFNGDYFFYMIFNEKSTNQSYFYMKNSSLSYFNIDDCLNILNNSSNSKYIIIYSGIKSNMNNYLQDNYNSKKIISSSYHFFQVMKNDFLNPDLIDLSNICSNTQYYSYFTFEKNEFVDFKKYDSFNSHSKINIYSDYLNEINDKCFNFKNETYQTDIDLSSRPRIYDKNIVTCENGCEFYTITNSNQVVCKCQSFNLTYVNLIISERNSSQRKENDYYSENQMTTYVFNCSNYLFNTKIIRNSGFLFVIIVIIVLFSILILSLFVYNYKLSSFSFVNIRENSTFYHVILIKYKDVLEYLSEITSIYMKIKLNRSSLLKVKSSVLNVFNEIYTRKNREISKKEIQDEVNNEENKENFEDDRNQEKYVIYDKPKNNLSKEVYVYTKGKKVEINEYFKTNDYKSIIKRTKMMFNDNIKTENNENKHEVILNNKEDKETQMKNDNQIINIEKRLKNLNEKSKKSLIIKRSSKNLEIIKVFYNSFYKSIKTYERVKGERFIGYKSHNKKNNYTNQVNLIKKYENFFDISSLKTKVFENREYSYFEVKNKIDILNENDISNISLHERNEIETVSLYSFIINHIIRKDIFLSILYEFSFYIPQYIKILKLGNSIFLTLLFNCVLYKESFLYRINNELSSNRNKFFHVFTVEYERYIASVFISFLIIKFLNIVLYVRLKHKKLYNEKLIDSSNIKNIIIINREYQYKRFLNHGFYIILSIFIFLISLFYISSFILVFENTFKSLMIGYLYSILIYIFLYHFVWVFVLFILKYSFVKHKNILFGKVYYLAKMI